MARDYERPPVVLVSNVIVECTAHVRIGKIDHRDALGIVVEEGGNRGLAVVRRKDAAAAVERAGLKPQHDAVYRQRRNAGAS